MKKTLLSLVLVASLLLSVLLVACDNSGVGTGSGDDYEGSESRLPVESHEDDTDPAGGDASETEKETDSALGVVEDTEEGWGEVHH